MPDSQTQTDTDDRIPKCELLLYRSIYEVNNILKTLESALNEVRENSTTSTTNSADYVELRHPSPPSTLYMRPSTTDHTVSIDYSSPTPATPPIRHVLVRKVKSPRTSVTPIIPRTPITAETSKRKDSGVQPYYKRPFLDLSETSADEEQFVGDLSPRFPVSDEVMNTIIDLSHGLERNVKGRAVGILLDAIFPLEYFFLTLLKCGLTSMSSLRKSLPYDAVEYITNVITEHFDMSREQTRLKITNVIRNRRRTREKQLYTKKKVCKEELE